MEGHQQKEEDLTLVHRSVEVVDLEEKGEVDLVVVCRVDMVDVEDVDLSTAQAGAEVDLEEAEVDLEEGVVDLGEAVVDLEEAAVDMEVETVVDLEEGEVTEVVEATEEMDMEVEDSEVEEEALTMEASMVVVEEEVDSGVDSVEVVEGLMKGMMVDLVMIVNMVGMVDQKQVTNLKIIKMMPIHNRMHLYYYYISLHVSVYKVNYKDIFVCIHVHFGVAVDVAFW